MTVSETSLKNDIKEALKNNLTEKEIAVLDNDFGLPNESCYRPYKVTSIEYFDNYLSSYLIDTHFINVLRKLCHCN